jgi:hypothetical protein
MKLCLLLVTGLILVGCSRQEQDNREVLAKLETIQSELATNRAGPVRWAFANKREIDSAIFKWSRDKMEANKKSEALAPEVEEKVREYERLQSELMRKQMESMRLRFPQRPGAPEPAAPGTDIGALSNRVAEARAPIADIVDRRNRQSSQLREQFSIDKLVAEYAKERFELVVDSSDEHFSRSAVLYRKGEVPDITEGVIKLFQEKTK